MRLTNESGSENKLHGVKFSYEQKTVAKQRVEIPEKPPLNVCELRNILKLEFHKIVIADVFTRNWGGGGVESY